MGELQIRPLKICLAIGAFIALGITSGAAQETVPFRGGVSIPEIPEYQDPFDYMIESVTSSINTKLGAIPRPDSRAVVLDRSKINSALGEEISSMSLIFACSKSQELNMEALKKYYSFVPEISVPTTAGECFLPEHSETIIVDSTSAVDLEEIISKFESVESLIGLDREYLKPLSEEMKRSYALEKSITDYAEVLARLDVRYGGIYAYLESGGEFPAALWPTPTTTSSSYLSWYLEACNWIQDDRRLRTINEFTQAFNARLGKSPVAAFQIAADYKKFVALRESMSLPKTCSPSYRHTANIDSYFVYGPKSLRDFVNEKPFAFLISLSSSTKWMQQEIENIGPSLEAAHAQSEKFENAAHKILDLSEGYQSNFSETVLASEGLVDEYRAGIKSREQRISEIGLIAPEAERKLEENLFGRAEYRASIYELEVRQEEIQLRMDAISGEQSALAMERTNIVSSCGDILEDCEIDGITKKKHVWLDEIQESRNKLSKELNGLLDRVSSIGGEIGGLFEKIKQSLVHDDALRAEIESASSGQIFGEKERLVSEIVELKSKISSKQVTIKEANSRSEHVSRITQYISNLVGR